VTDLKALNERAMSALYSDDLTQAEALIEQIARARPGHPQVVMLTGMLRGRQGQHEEAARLLESVLKLQPDGLTILFYLGNALQGLGRFEEAVERYDAALKASPDAAGILSCRGNALTALERFDEALASHTAALAQETADAHLWFNRGVLLAKMKRFGEALVDFERALAIRPDFTNALNAKGNALLSQCRLEPALACFKQALALGPDDATSLVNHAVALTRLGRYGEALADYERVLTIDPNYSSTSGHMALPALYACRWDRMAALAPQIPAQVKAGLPGHDPWTLMGYGMGGALLRQCAENLVRESFAPARPLWTGTGYGHSRIRLAYVSSDLRSHPVGFQLAEVLERHDRSRFEVIGISSGADDGSDIRARLVRAFDQFHDMTAKSDEEVARKLRALEVDIAIDLGGHTHANRLGAFAMRPAPVAASWLGHPGTTGADFIDYIIADAVVTPPEHQRFYSEKIVALPNSFFPLDTARVAGTCPTRAEAGLPQTGFVFCCFNRDWKITQPVFDTWLRLLSQIAGSVLWLRPPIHGSAAHLQDHAAAQGIDPARLVFADHAPLEVHLARHALADLFLDTLPYGAHATAADALLAGLPVLTQLAEIFPGRVGASLLTAAGLPELITRSAAEYEALALALARDPVRLKTLRDRLVAARATAPLFDMARFTKDLEAAYEAMLKEKTI
jgi:protein O-GlcNAc transferase